MEPAFYRGDLLFLVNPPNTRYEIGDITVYNIPGKNIPIVHRVLETHDVVKLVNEFVSTRVTLSRSINSYYDAVCSVRRAEPRPESQLLVTKGDQ